MFKFFKRNPLKNIEARYKSKLTKAMNAQRAGNIQEFAQLNCEAETIMRELEAIKNKSS